MTDDDRNVVRLKVGREEWRKIGSGILRESPSPCETVAFVLAGTHPASSKKHRSATTGPALGRGEHVRQADRHDRAGTQRTVPGGGEYGKPIRMRNEVEPISGKELLQRLCDE